MKKKLGLLGVGALALLSTACGGGYAYVARVPVAPPPPMARGYVPATPGVGFVWVDGYYDWRGGRHQWVAGRWMRPPRGRAVWVPGGWVQSPRGYHWRSGYWR